MITAANTAKEQTTKIANNRNMMVYNNNNTATAWISNGSEGGGVNSVLTTCNTTTTLEQYRLQLYNYALNMERLRAPPYTAAAAMAASAAYASTTTVSTATANCPSVNTANYAPTGHAAALPPQSTYLCTTTAAGSLIAATTHLGQTSSSLSQCPTNNRLALASMSLFPQRIFQPEEPKPQHSYIGLIAMAILNSTETKLVLSDIYQYILENYPYFRTRGPGWRNSIRHNLSLNDCFVKSGRSANGKGHYWAIHPANIEDFRKGDFRRRKAQRKVRKHMGLEIDDNGTDSPSPPPPMDLTSPTSPSFQHIVMGRSTITAAQHLAAQSFGWRFTHQQNRLHSQHPATNGTSASYVGQIFSYRPHHYAAAAAAAAAAALCHSNNAQQQHHLQSNQQQLVAQTSLHQHPTNENHVIEPITMTASQSSTYAQSNCINELFSQKRKRQFDVASLLAPDQSIGSKRKLSQQQYIRKHGCVDEMEDVALSTSLNEDLLYAHQPPIELDIVDIDVVEASENENLDNDYDEQDDGVESNSNSHSHSNSQNQNDDDEDEYVQKFVTEERLRSKSTYCKFTKNNITVDEAIFRVHDFQPRHDVEEESNEHIDDCKTDTAGEENEIEQKKSANSNNNDDDTFRTNKKTNSLLLNVPNSPLMPLTRAKSPPQLASHSLDANQLLEQTNDFQHSQLPSYQQVSINTEAHNLFGRYYGTYMAAAAAASMNSSMPPVSDVHNTE